MTVVNFAPLDIIECPGSTYYIFEPFLPGKFEKFSNNAGVVSAKSPFSQVLQTFSHFTLEKSGSSLLVCDLQGVEQGGSLLLTDPAIHNRSEAGRYGSTDLGYSGIQRFKRTHFCNDTCRRMGLQPLN